MKIKNIISLAILSVMTLSACSDIAEDERFIKGELVGGSDETFGFSGRTSSRTAILSAFLRQAM